jgi:hypothetical protein
MSHKYLVVEVQDSKVSSVKSNTLPFHNLTKDLPQRTVSMQAHREPPLSWLKHAVHAKTYDERAF